MIRGKEEEEEETTRRRFNRHCMHDIVTVFGLRMRSKQILNAFENGE